MRRRVDRIGEIEKGWSRALGPRFDRIDETATAVDEVARPAGDMSLRPAALVCGEALRARYGKRAEGLLRFEPDDCGLGAPSGGLKLGRAAPGEKTLFRAYSREQLALRTDLQR